jgi:hypothetical protein
MIPSASPKQRSKSAARLFALLGTVAALGATAACSSDGSLPPGSGSADQSADSQGANGSLSLALTLPGGLSFDSFTYAITGPQVAKSGTIDVSKSTTLTARIGDLPAGSDYSLTLLGKSLDPVSTCTGSAAFSVTAGAVTTVPIQVSCRLQAVAAAPVPFPSSASAMLGFVLLAVGVAAGRRARSA